MILLIRILNTIVVEFLCSHVYEFFKNGCAVLNDAENNKPSLFYRKGKDRYLTERPEPDIDWATVAPGTVCLVSHISINECQEEREFLCYFSGQKWFVNRYTKTKAAAWNYARIK